MRNRIQSVFGLLSGSSRSVRERYDSSTSRSLHISGLSGLVNLLLGFGKIVSGLLEMSAFTCVNGFYTLGMVLARYCALLGVIRAEEPRAQYRYYRWSGRILVLASLLYLVYSGWSYFHPRYTEYHLYIALAIATITFAEIGLNLRGVLIHRKNRSLLIHAMKTIHLAASLISLVLTQSALLAISGEGTHNPSMNALLGLLTGFCAALLGVYMLRRIRRMEREDSIAGEEKYDRDTHSGSGR